MSHGPSGTGQTIARIEIALAYGRNMAGNASRERVFAPRFTRKTPCDQGVFFERATGLEPATLTLAR
jgi:hypothetical protein